MSSPLTLTKPFEGTRTELEHFLKTQPETQRFRLMPLPVLTDSGENVKPVYYAEPLTEIEECRQLEEDWDGANAAAVSPATAELAKQLIVQTAEQVGSAKWINPSVSPDPNGHLHLLWCVHETRWLLIVNGQQPDALVHVFTPAQSTPQRKAVSFETAVQELVSALR